MVASHRTYRRRRRMCPFLLLCYSIRSSYSPRHHHRAVAAAAWRVSIPLISPRRRQQQQQQHLHLISMKQMAWQEKQWSVGRFVGNILVVVIVVSTRMWNSEKQTKREDSLTTTTFFGGGRTNGWTTTLARSLTHSLVGRFTSVGRRPRRIGSPHLFAIICIHKRNRTDLRNREKFPLCT